MDTHLFRVVDRLGLAQHTGTNNKTTREALVNKLLAYGPDLASAHFLFLLVGRDTCFKASPTCTIYFLQPHCDFATNGPRVASTSAGRVQVSASRTRRPT